MNENQVKGKLKEIGGKIQEEFGDAIDSPTQEAKGKATKVEGKTQKTMGDAQEKVENTLDDAARRPH
ncbi:CsbD family protein [Massilia oculi]|uniref:CsbD family protein n=1 Tax=Massilia hydrophila TaxID=3044279 RepID=A0ABS7YIJ7_9BURK|nr:CsbD family protein [Massilia sp. MS-15]MCA1858084.1 CsbD family protein [Massilia oculi]